MKRQKITKKAYHRLLLPEGNIVLRPVVEFNEQGKVVSWHPMESEEPFTEWVGGDFLLGVTTT